MKYKNTVLRIYKIIFYSVNTFLTKTIYLLTIDFEVKKDLTAKSAKIYAKVHKVIFKLCEPCAFFLCALCG